MPNFFAENSCIVFRNSRKFHSPYFCVITHTNSICYITQPVIHTYIIYNTIQVVLIIYTAPKVPELESRHKAISCY